ncbi:MAG: acyl-CoA dehydrogenase family protein, partial [Thermoplasmata archaeon]
MDLRLSDEELQIQEAARRFTRRAVHPIADRMDREDFFPRELFRRLGEEGFLGITLPAQYGGLELSYRSQALALQEFSRVSPALALSVGAHSNLLGDNLARNGSEELRARFLPAIATGERIGALALT